MPKGKTRTASTWLLTTSNSSPNSVESIDFACALKHNGQYEQVEPSGASEHCQSSCRGQLDPRYLPHDRHVEEHGHAIAA